MRVFISKADEKATPNLYVNAAEYYDYDVRDIVKVDIPFYLEYAEKTSKDVLELACGTGRVTLALAKNGHRVYGIDLSDSPKQYNGRPQMKRPAVELSKSIGGKQLIYRNK